MLGDQNSCLKISELSEEVKGHRSESKSRTEGRGLKMSVLQTCEKIALPLPATFVLHFVLLLCC